MWSSLVPIARRAARPAVLTVLAATLAVSAGCGGSRAAACDEMLRQLKQLTDRGWTPDWQESAKAYSDTAAAIRRAGARADRDVQAAANNLAIYLETKARKITAGQDPDEAMEIGYNLSGVCS